MELALNIFPCGLWIICRKKGNGDYICIYILEFTPSSQKHCSHAPGIPMYPDSPSTMVGALSWSLLLEPYISLTSKCSAQGCSPWFLPSLNPLWSHQLPCCSLITPGTLLSRGLAPAVLSIWNLADNPWLTPFLHLRLHTWIQSSSNIHLHWEAFSDFLLKQDSLSVSLPFIWL